MQHVQEIRAEWDTEGGRFRVSTHAEGILWSFQSSSFGELFGVISVEQSYGDFLTFGAKADSIPSHLLSQIEQLAKLRTLEPTTVEGAQMITAMGKVGLPSKLETR